MKAPRPQDPRKLMEELTREISEWEHSPYYLREQELFDLERFLDERGARELRHKLEEAYGTPLNRNFWSSCLAYRKLKNTRDGIKAQEDQQDEKRRRYLKAVEEGQRATREWLKEMLHVEQRRRIRIVSADKEDEPD